MSSVFGLPAGSLAVVLTVILFASAGVVTALALKNGVLLKLGLRNVRRRRARSALIVVGLMLGTAIIASALLTGDTMGRTVRASVIDALGGADEYLTFAKADTEVAGDPALTTPVPYVDVDVLEAVERATAGSLLVDGVAPAIIEAVAVRDATSRRSEPRVTLFGTDGDRMAPFGQLRSVEDGRAVSLTELGLDEVFLNADAGEELDAGPGDELTILIGDRARAAVVRDTVAFRGTGDDGPSVITSLQHAQAVVGRHGKINHILVSNAGDETGGVRHTDDVVALLDPVLRPLGLEADPVKQDGLELADAQGNAFMQLFTTFGSFSMAAGILLIFLIFVMLAAERRGEMGVARAIGTQRRHLVQAFLFEGAVYDVAAAAVGAALGVAVSFAMVSVTASAFGGEDLDLRFGFASRSLVIAYALGVLLTLAVVTLSAWRVSRLNIVTAIRNLDEPAAGGRRRLRIAMIGVAAGVGTLLAVNGALSQQMMPWMLGVSLLVVSTVPVVRAAGAPDRVAYTAAGSALVVWWLLPLDTFNGLFGEMRMDFSVWIVGGLLLVVGATWLVVYNSDVLLGGFSGLASRAAAIAPVVRIAVSYPLRSRFRTAVTLAMFTLVVFTLVTGSTISMAFIRAFDDPDRFGGGFHVRAVTAPAGAVEDLAAEVAASDLSGVAAGDIRAVGRQSYVAVEARQVDGSGAAEPYPLRGLDDVFMETTTYGFAIRAEGYATDAEVWQALRDEPGLAVIDSMVVPRRQNWGAGVLPDFRLEGFHLEDDTFEPVPVEIHDPQTGRHLDVTVIGVLRDDTPYSMAGITTSQAVLEPFGGRAVPTVHHVQVAPGVDPAEIAAALEAGFLANGLEADTVADVLDEAVGASLTFNRLIMGFMGLGLLVGVAALGVISARAVVERRQQLGVLRAIGFQPAMIRRVLLLETSFVALTAIAVGTVLGLVMSWNVIADASRQANLDGVHFAVPWLTLAVVFGAVYLAAVLTSLAPAVRAARVYPAEALRYQ